MVIWSKVSDFRHCFRSVALLAVTLFPPSVRKQLLEKVKTYLNLVTLSACNLF